MPDDVNEGIEALCSSPHLKRLQTLGLSGDGFDDDALLTLMDTPNLPMLREVRFDFSETPTFSAAVRKRFRKRFRLLDHQGHELRA